MTDFYHPLPADYQHDATFIDPASYYPLNSLPPSTYGLEDDYHHQYQQPASPEGSEHAPGGHDGEGEGEREVYDDDSLNPEHFPTEQVFQGIVDDYLNNLSERKRDKALIAQEMYDNVLLILQDPRNTATSTAQFRFWAKKMFQILEYKGEFVVTHDKRPVAVKEQIYDVLVYCHRQASHGGRDKTSSMTREYYSWVPKQLVAEFVKKCPTCLANRQKHPNFFGEGHPPVVVPRKSQNPSKLDPPPSVVPQTVTLEDARDAAKNGSIPKATGFFSRRDDDYYAYPGSKKKTSSFKASSSSKSKAGAARRPGQPITRESSGGVANNEERRPFDELEQHQRLLQQQRDDQEAQEFLGWKPLLVSKGSYHANGNPVNSRSLSTTSTLDSPALNTSWFYPLPGHSDQPYLSLPEHRQSVPELYGQQQSGCDDFDLGQRGSTGGRMGVGAKSGELDQLEIAEMMQAHQIQSSVRGGGYFGEGVEVNSSFNFYASPNGQQGYLASSNYDPHNQGLGFHQPSDPNAPLPTFNDPFPDGDLSHDANSAASTLNRANRPPPLNLTQQFQQYRTNSPLETAGAHLSVHQQACSLNVYSPSGLSPTDIAYDHRSYSSQGRYDALPGSAELDTLRNRVQQQLYIQEGGEQQDEEGEETLQFAYSVEQAGQGDWEHSGGGALQFETHPSADEQAGEAEGGKEGEGEKVAA